MVEQLITDEELRVYLSEGLTVTEIAKRSGLTKGAISKRLGRLKEKVVVPTVVRTGVPLKSPQGRLDAFSQLDHINRLCNEELDILQESLHACDESQRPALQRQQLAHVAEVRAQIKLLADIAQAVTHFEEVKRFQQIVLEELGNVVPEARDRVIARLEKRSHLGSLLGDS